jgi:hypothetical protein
VLQCCRKINKAKGTQNSDYLKHQHFYLIEKPVRRKPGGLPFSAALDYFFQLQHGINRSTAALVAKTLASTTQG